MQKNVFFVNNEPICKPQNFPLFSFLYPRHISINTTDKRLLDRKKSSRGLFTFQTKLLYNPNIFKVCKNQTHDIRPCMIISITIKSNFEHFIHCNSIISSFLKVGLNILYTETLFVLPGEG